jgi:hypothetical protein
MVIVDYLFVNRVTSYTFFINSKKNIQEMLKILSKECKIGNEKDNFLFNRKGTFNIYVCKNLMRLLVLVILFLA